MNRESLRYQLRVMVRRKKTYLQCCLRKQSKRKQNKLATVTRARKNRLSVRELLKDEPSKKEKKCGEESAVQAEDCQCFHMLQMFAERVLHMHKHKCVCIYTNIESYEHTHDIWGSSVHASFISQLAFLVIQIISNFGFQS